MPSQKEDKAIGKGIGNDPDTFEPTDVELKKFKRVGRPKAEVKKERITIRLSPEVSKYFRSTGKGWQTRIDKVLREYIDSH